MSDGIPEPPWRRARSQRSTPRAPLTREGIVDAALRLLDRDGLDGVSMRRVGEELGTGAASLYWHVGNKDELLDLVLDRVAGQIELPAPDPSRWQEQVKELARTARSAFKRHRDVARLAFGRVPVGPNTLRATEWLLAVLRAGGVPDRTSAYTAQLFWIYVGGFTFDESAEQAPPVGRGTAPEDATGMIREYFASLPAQRFANIVALADDLVSGDPDERFELGLDLLVSGLAAHAREHS